MTIILLLVSIGFGEVWIPPIAEMQLHASHAKSQRAKNAWDRLRFTPDEGNSAPAVSDKGDMGW